MKKVVIVVIVLLASMLATCGGCFTYLAITGAGLDDESKQWTEETVTAIVTDWNPDVARRFATPELDAQASEEMLQRVFTMFKTRLGVLQRLEEPKGQAHIGVTLKNGQVVSATYRTEGLFQKGKAIISTAAVKREGRWMLAGFHVNSDVFLDPSGEQPSP